MLDTTEIIISKKKYLNSKAIEVYIYFIFIVKLDHAGAHYLISDPIPDQIVKSFSDCP